MVQKSMTPKNKKKIRKEIADSRTKKHVSPERRTNNQRFSESDEQRERNFSREERSFHRNERKDDSRKNYRDERSDKKSNFRGEKRETSSYNKKPFEKRNERRFDDDRNSSQKRFSDRNKEEKKYFDKRTGDKYREERKPFEKRVFRKTDERNFEQRKRYERRFGDEQNHERREYTKKINFEEDRSSRFIDDESPLKKERRTGDNRRYSSYENNPVKTQKHRPTHADEMRLNKYLAHCGIAARRKADELIANGSVKVNGKIVREMGYKVMPGDEVRFKGKLITPEEKVYILINKPKDFITTAEDEKGRKTILQLIEGATEERVYPVGRLDRNTTGVLLLTNDGELAQRLSHPSFGVKKVYAVELDKPLSSQHIKMIAEGVELEDGVAMVDDIAYADAKNKKVIGIMLHVGKNRIVRRIFEHLGYEVVRLDRTLYAGLDKKNLERGKWRFLSEKEITNLKRMK